MVVSNRAGSSPVVGTMEKEIELAIRKAYNKYLVRHVPIKNDDRCRTEIMFEEATNEIMKIIKCPNGEIGSDTQDLKSCPKG